MDYKDVDVSLLGKNMFKAFILLDISLTVIFHDEVLRVLIGAWDAGAALGYKILGY